MKLGVLFSGGKDSTLAADWAAENFEIGCLISMKSKNPESYMFHVPGIEMVEKQAKAMKLPLVFWNTEGEKELELIDLEAAIKYAIRKYKIEGIVAGSIASKYQRDRIEKICEDLNIKPFSPYWHYDPEEYMNLLIEKKYKTLLSAVAADGLTAKHLGKKITKQFLKEMKILSKKHRFHLAGEGGEYETFAFDGPLFKKKLNYKIKEKNWDGYSGSIIID